MAKDMSSTSTMCRMMPLCKGVVSRSRRLRFSASRPVRFSTPSWSSSGRFVSHERLDFSHACADFRSPFRREREGLPRKERPPVFSPLSSLTLWSARSSSDMPSATNSPSESAMVAALPSSGEPEGGRQKRGAAGGASLFATGKRGDNGASLGAATVGSGRQLGRRGGMEERLRGCVKRSQPCEIPY